MSTKNHTTFRTRYLNHPVHLRWVAHWKQKASDHQWAKSHPREAYFVERIAPLVLEFTSQFTQESAQKISHWCLKAQTLQPALSESTLRSISEFHQWLRCSGRLSASITQ